MMENEILIEAVGWAAAAVVTVSYLFRDVLRLRVLQICGALLWLCYGILITSPPVVVANLLVVAVACWTTARYSARRKATAAGTG
jgi:uncharacterized protein with PQ loop repeat